MVPTALSATGNRPPSHDQTRNSLSELTLAFRKSEYDYNWVLFDPVTVPARETTVVCLKQNKPTCTNIAGKFPGTCYVDMQIGLFAASYLADVRRN